MKRQLTVALGLAVVATPAFATKARLEALGEDTFGSYYINDNRNIFLNPAKINDNKDFVTYEFGAAGNTSTAVDSSANPRASGGFVKSHGNMAYGLNFGDSSQSTSQIRGLTAGGLQEVQPWDFHIGGDAGVKWGASVTYENYDGQGQAGGTTRLASQGTRLRGGVVMGDLDVFAQVSLGNASKDFAGNATDGKTGLFLGAGYMMNNYKLFADWRSISTDYTSNAGANGAGVTASATADKKFSSNVIRLGVGRQERLNDRATLFAKAMVTRTSVDDKGNSTYGVVAGKIDQTVLPVNVGIEYAATSWLDLRASVVNNVFSQQDNKPKGASKSHTHVANTAVRAGASLKFGEFSIDGLISNDTNANGVADQASASTSAGGNLRADSLMTRVAMIYRF